MQHQVNIHFTIFMKKKNGKPEYISKRTDNVNPIKLHIRLRKTVCLMSNPRNKFLLPMFCYIINNLAILLDIFINFKGIKEIK